MKSLKCQLLTIWYTLRHPSEGMLLGQILSGHDFENTGEVHDDHWEIRCKRCGFMAGSEQK
jgi:hypothetical protein